MSIIAEISLKNEETHLLIFHYMGEAKSLIKTEQHR